MVIKTLPVREKRLEMIKVLQEEDEVCKCIKQYCVDGWPDISTIFWSCWGYFSQPALERIATDLFQLKGHTYLLVIDYFSRYIEISKHLIYEVDICSTSHTTGSDVRQRSTFCIITILKNLQVWFHSSYQQPLISPGKWGS